MNIIPAEEIKKTGKTYLIYGTPGMGKTRAASFYPGKTLVLDVDRTSHVLKGEKNIDVAYVDNINTWSSWRSILAEVTKLKGYQNIVVDNVSELERCILSDLGRQGKNNGVPSMGDYQYMQIQLVNSLRYLKETNANIILIAWEYTDKYTSADGREYNRTMPQVNGKILSNIMGLCDVVARLTLNSEGVRGFVLQPTKSIFAKNQLDDRKGCLQDELIPTPEGTSPEDKGELQEGV